MVVIAILAGVGVIAVTNGWGVGSLGFGLWSLGDGGGGVMLESGGHWH